MSKPKLAVFKFASCDGCQLSILDLEDELLAITSAIEIANFLQASRAVIPGPYDVTLVEGSITTEDDRQRIKEVRAQSKFLITIGACASSGGIQALKNFQNVSSFISAVYASPEYISTLKDSKSISDHVPVDFELRGCPINKYQLVEVISSLLNGKKPATPSHSVCLDCKRAGHVCVMISEGRACLGPVTHAGCSALCPGYNRGCFGCYGPADTCNVDSLIQQLSSNGSSNKEIFRLLQTFNANSSEFRQAAEKVETKNG